MSETNGRYPYRALLEHIDIHLLPLLKIPFSVVQHALDSFCYGSREAKHCDVYIKVNDMKKYFPPEYISEIIRISHLLSSEYTNDDGTSGGIKINFMDVLLVLIITSSTGTLRDRARLLFDWFDFTKSEMLSEVELTSMLNRLASCLSRIKLLSSFEIGLEDARHMALLARILPDNTMVPEVSFETFLLFLDTNKATLTARRILSHLNRLLECLCRFDQRIHHVDAIVRNKAHSIALSDIATPRLDLFTSIKLHPQQMKVLFVGDYECSLLIPTSGIDGESVTGEVYVKVEELLPIDSRYTSGHDMDYEDDDNKDNRYNSNSIINGRKASNANTKEKTASTLRSKSVLPEVEYNEDGQFLATNYYSCRLFRNDSKYKVPFMRGDVLNLSPGHTYYITAYTREWKFEMTKITTGNGSNSSSSSSSSNNKALAGTSADNITNESSSSIDHSDDVPHDGICILPGDISGSLAEKVLSRVPMLWKCRDAIVTGPLWCADDVVEELLSLLQTSRGTSSIYLASSAAGALYSRCRASGLSRVYALLDLAASSTCGLAGNAWIRAGYQGSYDSSYSDSSDDTAIKEYGHGLRLTSYDGGCVWSSQTVRSKHHLMLQDRGISDEAFLDLESRLEAVTQTFMGALRAPLPYIYSGNVIVMLIKRSRAFNCDHVGGNSIHNTIDNASGGSSANEKVMNLSQGVSVLEAIGLIASPSVMSNCKSLVITARTPFDLMDIISTWSFDTIHKSGQGADASNTTLTGAHEIKFGAYSAEEIGGTTHELALDKSFYYFIDKVLAWLNNSHIGTSGATTAVGENDHNSTIPKNCYVVFTNWNRGFNFDITRMVSGAGGASVITFSTLLPSVSSDEATLDARHLLLRMKGSLPRGCQLNVANVYTGLRAFKALGSTSSSDSSVEERMMHISIPVELREEGIVSSTARTTQITNTATSTNTVNVTDSISPSSTLSGMEVEESVIINEEQKKEMENRTVQKESQQNFTSKGEKQMKLVADTSNAQGQFHLPVNHGLLEGDVDVLDYPQIVKVSCHEVTVRCRCIGYGNVVCSLYELPTSLTLDDAVSLIRSERKHMVLGHQLTKRCTKDSDMVFNFNDLTAYTNYLACIDTSRTMKNEFYATHAAKQSDQVDKQGKFLTPCIPDRVGEPKICCFRSLSREQTDGDTFIVAGVTTKDCCNPSFAISKIEQLLEISRMPSTPVYLIHQYSEDGSSNSRTASVSVDERGRSHLLQASLADLSGLKRRGSSVHSLVISATPSLEFIKHIDTNNDWRKCCHVEINGKFGRLSVRDDSSQSLYSLYQSLEYIESVGNAKLQCLSIFLPNPIIPYERRKLSSRGKVRWLGEGLMRGHTRLLVENVLRRLTIWKYGETCRDVVFVSVMDVNTPRCAIVSYKSIINSNNNNLTTTIQGYFRQCIVPCYLPQETDSYNPIDMTPVRHHHHHHHEDKENESIRENAYPETVRFPHSTGNSNNNQSYSRNDNNNYEDMIYVSDNVSLKMLDASDYRSHAAIEVSYPRLDLYSPLLTREQRLAREERRKDTPRPFKKHPVYPFKFVKHPLNEYEQLMQDRLERGLDKAPDPKLIEKQNYKWLLSDALPQREPLIHVVDFLCRQKEDLSYRKTVSTTTTTTTTTTTKTVIDHENEQIEMLAPFQLVKIKMSVDPYDFLDVIIGPLVGKVTHNKAIVLVEINRDLRYLKCIFRPHGVGESIELRHDNAKAYHPIHFESEELLPCNVYEVLLPDIHGNKVLATFRTQLKHPYHVDLLVAGNNNPTMKSRSIASGVDHLMDQQMIDLQSYLRDNAALGQHSSRDASTELWEWLYTHLNATNTPFDTTIHLGTQTFLADALNDLGEPLLQRHLSHLQLPLAQASGVGAWYFYQLEQLIRDVLRVSLSVPRIQTTLKRGSTISLYHSDNTVPTPRGMTTGSDDAERGLAVLRKVFESYFDSYICKLWDTNSDSGHRGHVYQAGTLKILMLDAASERKKMKKGRKKEGVESEVSDSDTDTPVGTPVLSDRKSSTTETPQQQAPGTYSTGFLDKLQWKFVRSVLADSEVTHIALSCQYPFVPLHALPAVPESSSNLPKGSLLPWSPTVDDLKQSFTLLFKWMAPSGGAKQKRHCLLLCTGVGNDALPYVTTIEDSTTGAKIFQLVTGTLGSGGQAAPIPSNYVAFGRIGSSITYQHRLTNLNNVILDSTQGKVIPVPEDRVSHDLPLPQSGLATIRIWFDSFSAIGNWNFNYVPPRVKSSGSDRATMVLGPILGTFISTTITPKNITDNGENNDDDKDIDKIKEEMFELPVLMELDQTVKVTFRCKNTFTSREFTQTFNFHRDTPTVVKLGPFPREVRIKVDIIDGILECPHLSFTVSTHFHQDDTNIMVLNCDPYNEATTFCSDFIADIGSRCSLPFHGYSAVVHTNFSVNLDSIINAWLHTDSFIRAASHCWKTGHLNHKFRDMLSMVADSMRVEFRNFFARPSYRELLKICNSIISPRVMYNVTLDEIRTHLGAVVDDNQKSKKKNDGQVSDSESEDDYEEEEVVIGLEAVRILLYLFAARMFQEYLMQLRSPGQNVFQTISEYELKGALMSMAMGSGSHNSDNNTNDINNVQNNDKVKDFEQVHGDAALSAFTLLEIVASENVEENVAADPSSGNTNDTNANPNDNNAPPNANKIDNKRFIYGIDHSLSLEDAVFLQWTHRMAPVFTQFVDWVSPNKKCSLEMINDITPDPIHQAKFERAFRTSPIDIGTRIMLLSSSVVGNHDPCSQLLSEDQGPILGTTMRKLVNEWTHTVESTYENDPETGESVVTGYQLKRRTDREITLVSTTTSLGSSYRIIPDIEEGYSLGITLIDSVFRHNAFLNEAAITEAETNAKKAIKGKKSSGAMSKAKMEKMKKEEEELSAKLKAEVEEMITSQIPDGYALIETSTQSVSIEQTLPATVQPSLPIVAGGTDDGRNNEGTMIAPSSMEANDNVDAVTKSQVGYEDDDIIIPPAEDTQDIPNASGRNTIGNIDATAGLVVNNNDDGGGTTGSTPMNGGTAMTIEEVTEEDTIMKPKIEMETRQDTLQITNSRAFIIGSVTGGKGKELELELVEPRVRPSRSDYLQPPGWLAKMSPGSAAVFLQDEVILTMRNETGIRELVLQIELPSVILEIERLYSSSKLSQLELSVDERVLDMDIPGVVEALTASLIDEIWTDVVPQHCKDYMLPLNDAFTRAYLLARVMPTREQMVPAATFAKCIQKALVLSLALGNAVRMTKIEEYAYLMKQSEIDSIPVDYDPATESDLEELLIEEEKFIEAEMAADDAAEAKEEAKAQRELEKLLEKYAGLTEDEIDEMEPAELRKYERSDECREKREQMIKERQEREEAEKLQAEAEAEEAKKNKDAGDTADSGVGGGEAEEEEAVVAMSTQELEQEAFNRATAVADARLRKRRNYGAQFTFMSSSVFD